LKKEPKTFVPADADSCPAHWSAAGMGKSFLFLFFKKETFPLFAELKAQ
jgi:hypothetical protein